MTAALDQLSVCWSSGAATVCVLLIVVVLYSILSREAVPTLQLELSRGDQAVMAPLLLNGTIFFELTVAVRCS